MHCASNRADILALLQRREEYDSARDSIDNFEAQHCARRWDGSLYRPIIDDFLDQHEPAMRITWPKGKRFAACLTHDVDCAQLDSPRELLRTINLHLRHAGSAAKKLRHLVSIAGLWKSPRKTDIFTPWVDLEQELGFRSTFFFFATRISQRYPIDNVYRWNDQTFYRGVQCSLKELMRDLHHRDCEIGLHSSYLSHASYDLLMEQKEDVEKTLGETVISNRQHNLHFDARVTPAIIERAGLKIDSTLGFNRDVGFRAGTSRPFPLWNAQDQHWLSVIEIPLMLHDGALLRSDNLDLDPTSSVALGKRLIDRVIARNGVITLLWHPESIAKPGWFDVYNELLRYVHMQHGWGASARQIHQWWVSQGFEQNWQEILDTL